MSVGGYVMEIQEIERKPRGPHPKKQARQTAVSPVLSTSPNSCNSWERYGNDGDATAGYGAM
jgi:hypothetical protein